MTDPGRHAHLDDDTVYERLRMCLAEAGYDPAHATRRGGGTEDGPGILYWYKDGRLPDEVLHRVFDVALELPPGTHQARCEAQDRALRRRRERER